MKLGPYTLGPTDDEHQGIYTGDCRTLAESIPDESVDLIFTDPPYSKQFLPCFFWLFEFAERVLKPTGFLLSYVGGFWKDAIMARAREHLDYFWDYTSWEKGDSPIIWPRKTITRAKSILAYRPMQSDAMPRTNVLGLWSGSAHDKRYHAWGQDASTTRYYIDCFSSRRAIIVDPFCGGGTTPAMAHVLGRWWLAFEIDPSTANIARDRVHNAPPPLFKFESEQLEMDMADD